MKLIVKEGTEAEAKFVEVPEGGSLEYTSGIMGSGRVGYQSVADGLDVWFDDEYLYQYEGQAPTLPGILGPVVFAGVDIATGDTIGLTEAGAAYLLGRLNGGA